MKRFEPTEVGWRLGVAHEPRGGQLWVPWDRTAGVIGPQGSGKTLDLLIPALLAAPGAALVTLTKADDLLLSIDDRSSGGRPCVVLDPFGLAPGLPELVWDPIAGCVDPMVAERRAKAFTAGTVSGAGARGQGDDAARFYAAEAAKVIQGYFHAAALTGRTLDHVLRWVANPVAAAEPTEILREHPHAAPFWHGLLHGALHGDDRTAGNTITTVQQALALFFQEEIRRRCVPGPGRPATDIADVIDAGGTIYLLGRESPYESASPLMTAVAEHVLDTALARRQRSQWGRLCPPMLACLDELPSTAPLPTLRTRMANERALGISFIWAAQTGAQLTQIFGDHEARAVLGLTNTLVLFGGSKDVAFNQEISDLLGPVRVARTTWQTGRTGRSVTGEDIPILTGAEIRQLPERHALVVAENGKPIIAKLTRCIDGRHGRRLLANQAQARARMSRRAGPPGTTPMPEPPPPSSRPADAACTNERQESVMTRPDPEPAAVPLVQPFPQPGRLVEHAYRELAIAANGTPEQKRALGDPRRLPRPWDPPTCTHPDLRLELWVWLDDVVTWINHEYVWDTASYIPACWPEHPHLVHDLAVLADQRRRAGLAHTSDALEDWHRYALPAFLDRMTSRLKSHCENGHQPWPSSAATPDTPATPTAGDAQPSSTLTPPRCAPCGRRRRLERA